MGKGIKTRNVAEKGIKAIDKAAVASERMKEAYIRTKDKAEHGMYAEEGSPGEYASDRLSAGVDNVTHEAVSYTHLDVYKRQPLPCWALSPTTA